MPENTRFGGHYTWILNMIAWPDLSPELKTMERLQSRLNPMVLLREK